MHTPQSRRAPATERVEQTSAGARVASPHAGKIAQLAAIAHASAALDRQRELIGIAQAQPAPLQRKASAGGGLPAPLKSGIEQLSGMAMDHVKVHYNSSRPAQLSAHAYAQGSEIHLAPGQERHLPHEAWHVVQQAQGRVRPTMQMKGGSPVNADQALELEADTMGAAALGKGAGMHHRPDAGRLEAGANGRGGALQLKWIHSTTSRKMVWDQPIGGVRWFFKAGRYYFEIEDHESTEAIAAFEGMKKTREEWMQLGFEEGKWKKSDGEIVSFRPVLEENIKISNSEQEITRGHLEGQARDFLDSGEAGDAKAMKRDYVSNMAILLEHIKNDIRDQKAVPPGQIEKIDKILKKNWATQSEAETSAGELEWKKVQLSIRLGVDKVIRRKLNHISRTFGKVAFVESVNAATNLVKRLLLSAPDLHPSIKLLQVWNMVRARVESLEFRATSPIRVTRKSASEGGAQFDGGAKSAPIIKLGTRISALESQFDVLARRTGANKNANIQHIHEVDLAFISAFRGLTEAYANPEPHSNKLIFQGGGGVGEKVFAVGHKGAVDFRKEADKKEERFYALILPKGFIAYYGKDLMKAGKKSAVSAREPNEREFSEHSMPAMNGDPLIQIEGDKMFFIRAEKSTPDHGQVDVHFGWRGMAFGEQETTHADFFRRHVLGVVEFTKGGRVIRFKSLE